MPAERQRIMQKTYLPHRNHRLRLVHDERENPLPYGNEAYGDQGYRTIPFGEEAYRSASENARLEARRSDKPPEDTKAPHCGTCAAAESARCGGG